MTQEEFRKQKSQGREEINQKILEVFKSLNPVAIHQFGSGTYGYRDEFSDIDLWITFEDEQIDKVIANRLKIYESIASILLINEAPKNSPLGGKYSLVIFETDKGLFHVDFYLSSKSRTVIRAEAKHLWGDSSLPRGEWIMDREALEVDTLSFQIDAISFMCFIGIKGVIRGWKGPDFENFIFTIYHHIEELTSKKLHILPEKLSFLLIYQVLTNVYPFAQPKQRYVIEQIQQYAKQVEELYFKT